MIAIDIGKAGALASDTEVIDMPIRRVLAKPAVTVFARDSSNKKILIKSGPREGTYKQVIKSPAKYITELDTKAIYYFMAKEPKPRHLTIELPGNSQGNSARSSATTATNYGKLLAIAELLDFTIKPLPANQWKKALSLPAEKLPTVRLAEQLRPHEQFRSSRGKLYDGRADAVAIHHYITT